MIIVILFSQRGPVKWRDSPKTLGDAPGLSDVRDARVVRGAGAGGGPEEPAIGLGDGDVVDAGLAAPHQAPFVELPQLVAVAAMPEAVGVVPLVLESYADPVVCEGPQVLHEPIVELAGPLAGQEPADLVAAD